MQLICLSKCVRFISLVTKGVMNTFQSNLCEISCLMIRPDGFLQAYCNYVYIYIMLIFVGLSYLFLFYLFFFFKYVDFAK